MSKTPILVWMWDNAFDPGSGGMVVMHKLCGMLREKGEDAYIWYDQGHPYPGQVTAAYGLPFANGKLDPKDCVAVYPEIVTNNPLSAKVVVRWILYHIGYWGKRFTPAQDDIVAYYAPWFYENDTDPSHQLTIFDVQEEKFKFTDVPQRSGICYVVRKGKHKPKIPETEIQNREEIPNRPCHIDYTSQIFRRREAFYSYDSTTTLSLHAAMCGCLSIVVPDRGITPEEYRRKMPLHKYGIAYGTSKEEIDHARSTQHLVLDYLKSVHDEGYKQLDVLISRIKSRGV